MSSFLDMERMMIKPIMEIQSLIPDSVLFGSLLLYFLTRNLSFGVFGIFLVEVMLSHRFLSWALVQLMGPSSRSLIMSCRAGFKTPQYHYQRIFSHEAYPSYSVFSVTAIATYLGLATSAFSSTMKEMGREWSTRSTVAYVFLGLFLTAFLLARGVFCEGTEEILLAMFLAVIVGFVGYQLHQRIFGIESVNFLGLPYLVRKDEDGTSIYVCGVVPPSTTPSS